MTTDELYALAARIRELADNDPMDEDQTTEFIDLATILASWIAPVHVTLTTNSQRES